MNINVYKSSQPIYFEKDAANCGYIGCIISPKVTVRILCLWIMYIFRV